LDQLEIVNLDNPVEIREFDRGRFEVYELGGRTLGRATYEPGWRWTEHVGPTTGEDLCGVEHLGLVISGRAAVLMEDGTEQVMGPGDLFAVPPRHDSWVVGDQPYLSLHLIGAERYAAAD